MSANIVTPDQAIDALASRLRPVSSITSDHPIGLVLAEDLTTDRNSPAANVSAMDGYAIRLSDLRSGEPVAISGQSLPGAPPPEMVEGAVVQIFTGALVPDQAEAVVQREHTEEFPDRVRFLDRAQSVTKGTNIRFAGENIRAGEVYLESGTLLKAAQTGALTNFGVQSVRCHAPVRVAVLTTGDELSQSSDEVTSVPPIRPWQIRNSNRTALLDLFHRHAWVSEPTALHVVDDPAALRNQLADAIDQHDAVLMTGGVSAGDRDYVPQAVKEVGGDILFHKLPLRPGRPILGALTGRGKLILGLPGNPVSATMGARRFAFPLLARLSGQTEWKDRATHVRLKSPGTKTLPLHWMRGVRLLGEGMADLVIGKGSGDLVTLAQSDGFIEMPPDATGEGPWPFFEW